MTSPTIPGVRRFARIRRGERLLARGAFCLVLAFFVAIFSGLTSDLTAEAEFQTVSALGRGNGFSIGGTPESEGLLANRPDDWTANWTDDQGQEWSAAPMAQANTGEVLASVPLYWLGKVIEALAPGADSQEQRFASRTLGGFPRSEYFAHLLVGLRNPLLAALCVWLVVLCASRLGLSRTAAFVAGMGYGLCTYAMPLARQPFGSIQATALLLGAFYLILTAREALERGRRPARHFLLIGGFSLGFAWMSQDDLGYAVGVLACTMWVVLVGGHRWLKELRIAKAEPAGQKSGQLQDLLLFTAPLLVLVAAGAGLNWMRFDSMLGPGKLALGESVMAPSWAWASPGEFARLVVSPGGLLVLAPLLLLVPWGFVLSDGRASRFSRNVIVLLTLAVVFGGGVAHPGAQPWTSGPVDLLPCMPFLVLVAAVALERMRTTARGRFVTLALLVFGFLSNAGGVLVHPATFEQLATDFAGSTEAPIDLPSMEFDHAAPWASWRIFRHRLAGLGEEFSAAEIFFGDPDLTLVANPETPPGQEHLTWLDMQRNLGAESWPIGVVLLLLIGQGIRLLLRSTDH